MKKILQYLKTYQKDYFDLRLYLAIGLFIVVCISVNYYFDFEDSVIDAYRSTPFHSIFLGLFQAFPFFCVCLILWFFRKSDAILKKSFWFKFLIGFTLLGLDRGFYGYTIFQDAFHRLDWVFVSRCMSTASSNITVVIPLLVIYQLVERDNPKIWYGLKWEQFDPKPYLILLGIATIFLAIGSFWADINSFYPRYIHATGAHYLLRNHPDLAEWKLVTLYELAYGSNFISVELMFRGFLIFAFTRTLGGYAVLAMVASYAFLHFGKPIGETISSVFGGYILGIIAFYSRNVWGGVFIHLGVAWLMELFGWLQQS